MRTKKNTERNRINIIVPILLLVVIVVATGLGTAMSWDITTRRMEAIFEAEMKNQAEVLCDRIERKFAVLEGYSASFAQTDIDDTERVLEKLRECTEKTDFSEICFAYSDGVLYRDNGLTMDIEEHSIFNRAMQGNNGVTIIYGADTDGISCVIMGVPVKIKDEVQGMLLGLYEKDVFSALFEEIFSEISEISFICDSNGTFILGTNETEELWNNMPTEIPEGGGLLDVLDDTNLIVASKKEVELNMKNREGGRLVYDYNGERRHTTYMPLGINDWYIVAVVNDYQIYQEAVEMAEVSYVMMFLIMIAVLLIIFYLANKEHKIAVQEKKKKEELKYLAEHDDLTGVLKEKAFLEQVGNRLAEAKAREYCLVYLDIYKFKLINEMFGYAKGDELLKALAEEIKKLADSYNGLCGRVSGDEFVLLLPNKKEIIDEFYTKKYKKKRIIPIEFYLHYGIYVIQDTKILVARMVDCAQVAQKTVKGNYDNCVAFYDDKIKQQLVKEQEIITSMRQALENEEFVVYLQPQYDYRDGTICGAEALVRWNSPVKGLISPGDFLPIFETNGFIIKLDEYMWEQVCKLQRKWLDEGKKIFPISVNVSRADLLRGAVAEKLMSLLEKYDLTPDMLRVEITESAYMDNPQQLIMEISKLKECGLVVEMDDFGSGYSSLNMLKDVPIQVLKTDLRFLSATGIEDRKDYILDSVISMAHKMGMSVIAEGVETKEQADYLLSLRCDYMQGYYFSKPMPVINYEKIVYPD